MENKAQCKHKDINALLPVGAAKEFYAVRIWCEKCGTVRNLSWDEIRKLIDKRKKLC